MRGDIAASGGQRLENRIQLLHHFLRSADHHAVAAFQSPDAAAGPDINVVNALVLELGGAANVIFEIGVAAVDENVAGLHALGERVHGLLRGTAGRNHQPGDAGLAQFGDEVIERSGADRALAGKSSLRCQRSDR